MFSFIHLENSFFKVHSKTDLWWRSLLLLQFAHGFRVYDFETSSSLKLISIKKKSNWKKICFHSVTAFNSYNLQCCTHDNYFLYMSQTRFIPHQFHGSVAIVVNLVQLEMHSRRLRFLLFDLTSKLQNENFTKGEMEKWKENPSMKRILTERRLVEEANETNKKLYSHS